jgi:hypothetical protein
MFKYVNHWLGVAYYYYSSVSDMLKVLVGEELWFRLGGGKVEPVCCRRARLFWASL